MRGESARGKRRVMTTSGHRSAGVKRWTAALASVLKARTSPEKKSHEAPSDCKLGGRAFQT